MLLRVTNRVCFEQCNVQGIHFKPGMVVQANVNDIHMDPDLWGPEDPALFVPERSAAILLS